MAVAGEAADPHPSDGRTLTGRDSIREPVSRSTLKGALFGPYAEVDNQLARAATTGALSTVLLRDDRRYQRLGRQRGRLQAGQATRGSSLLARITPPRKGGGYSI